MSGDVQPRKRKDKRKKRDDRKSEGDVSVLRQPSFQDDDDSSSHGVHITKMGNDDVHLHVQHQHGTGGHWCAKIIFFSLMAVLLGLVGLIIMENRGLEDLDTPLSESRYSNYFDGWVEEHRHEDEHDDPHDAHESALDDHDEHDDAHDDQYELHSGEEEAEEEHEDHEEEEEEEDNTAAENVSAEDDDGDNKDDEDIEDGLEKSVEPMQSAADEEDDDAVDEDADEDADEDIEESIEPPVSQSTAQSAPDHVDDDDDNIDEDDDEDVDEEIEESIEPPVSQSQAQSAPETLDDEDDDEEPFDDNDDDNEESVEPAAQSLPDAADDDDNDDDLNQDDDDDNDDDDFESLDQQFEDDAEELLLQQKQQRQASADSKVDQKQDNDDDNSNKEEEEATTSSWLGSLAVKLGVGIALALVSRLVLLRKNPNTTEELAPPPEANLRRRLTIASAEDNIPDDVEELPPLDDEEYSEEEIEIEEEIEVDISDIEGSDNDNVAITASYMPETFEQLSAMYRSKPESSKPQPKPADVKPTKEPTKLSESATEGQSDGATAAAASDIYIEYEEGDIEDYEHDESDDEGEEISDEEEDEISDVDDAELMSRLEAKYGRLPAKEYESDPDSDDPSWTQIKPKEQAGAKSAEEDDLFEQELRNANAEMMKEPTAHLKRAQALAQVADKRKNKELLIKAIESYKRYLAFGALIVNQSEYRAAAERCIHHLRSLRYLKDAVTIHKTLIDRYPDIVQPRNELSLTYLMLNNLVDMQQLATETLKRWPSDALAHLYLGLSFKQLDGDYAKAVPHLLYAINSRAHGTQEAFFYLALGESLQRLRQNNRALTVFERSVGEGFFPSIYQRSLYNVDNLRAKPIWQVSETDYSNELLELQKNWQAIRKEAMLLLYGKHFVNESEQLLENGAWQQFELFSRGQRHTKNCQRAPFTCGLFDKFAAVKSCMRGQVKFSILQPETHIWPHCGPTNCRLRVHLTLVAQEPHLMSMRVVDHEVTWRPGDLLIFDDSFEHEIWHNGTILRVVLIVDIWHPDLTEAQRRNLSPI